VLPVPAEGAGLIWNPSIRGRLPGGRAFATVTFNAGGMGAQADRDGWNTTAFPSGVKTMPVEAVEQTVPVLIRRKELLPDSGGAGTFRGGLGQRIEIESDSGGPFLLNAMFDRTTHPALGRNGGRDGARGAVALASGRSLRGKGLQEIPAGDRLVLMLPGGGGHGDPARRDPARLALDLREGYVTPAGAARDYGV
jgi:N-methylhydantoinase B